MSNDQAGVPPGWFEGPDGRRRYWNGAGWTDLSDPTGGKRRTLPKIPKPILILGAVLILFAVVGGAAWKVDTDRQAAKEDADRLAAAELAEGLRVSTEVARRNHGVDNVESSIRTMAADHISSGILRGEVLSVTCTPTDGADIEDLDRKSIELGCFVGTQQNDDGTQRGYNYHATLNFVTGTFTYGLGAP